MDSEYPNRRVSTVITLTALILVLVAGAILGMRSLFAPLPGAVDDVATSPSCTPKPVQAGKRLTSTQVTVSVFNAGDRSGLASDTLEKLAERGFRAGDTGNAPEGTDVRGVQVWTTEEDDPAARLVARQFGPRTVVLVSDDLGVGIDVIVGSRYRGMVDAPRFVRIKKTQEVCVEG